MGDGTSQPLSYIERNEKNPMKCLQRCDFQTDSVVMSSTQLVLKDSFPSMQVFCQIFQKVARICNSNIFRVKYFEEQYPNLNCSYIKKQLVSKANF